MKIKKFYNDANNLFGYAMSQSLPYDEIEMWKGHHSCYVDRLEYILNTPDDSDFGDFLQIDLKYPDKIEEKTKIFRFAPEN